MTREEAIKILKEERWYMSRYSEEYKEAYDMAIEALHREEAEEKGYCHRILPSNVEVVVRCKDCKKRGAFGEKGFCVLYAQGVPDEHYCSYGERREP